MYNINSIIILSPCNIGRQGTNLSMFRKKMLERKEEKRRNDASTFSMCFLAWCNTVTIVYAIVILINFIVYVHS